MDLGLSLNFESHGFKNVEISSEFDADNRKIKLRTNVQSKEEFQRWKEVFCTQNKLCFNSYRLYHPSTWKSYSQVFICHHGVEHKGLKKTSTGCQVLMKVSIRNVLKRSPKHLKEFPCFIEITGKHNHSLETAEGLRQLRVAANTKTVFETYFEQGMTPSQAHAHHVLKLDLCDDICGQADHATNPTLRAVQYLWDSWRNREHGGLQIASMSEALNKYAKANPEITVRCEHSNNTYCILLLTPFMVRAHKHLREAGEVVFVDATSCVDQLNTSVIPFLCAGPAGAVPLAILFTSSQDEAMLTKGFSMVKEALGECAFYGRGAPQSIMTDNCEAERKALASTWPSSKLFLCIFHILQQVWRWLLDSKHCIPKEDRQELMSVMKSLVYASSRQEFDELWKKVEASCLLEKYSNFRSYITTLVQRREEWAIAFRAGSMLRGHNTNNYAESTMCIIKDIVLNRYKAYNVVQLLMFMVEIFDSYMRQRLVDVALGRQKVKSIVVNNVSSSIVKSHGEGKYAVQSQSLQTEFYEVDLSIGICSCVKGQSGAICKHQIACADYAMIALPQVFVGNSDSRQSLAALAIGAEKVPSECFFKGLTEREGEKHENDKFNVMTGANMNIEPHEKELEIDGNKSVDDSCSDLREESKLLTEAIIEAVALYGNADSRVALNRFYHRVKLVKTANQLNSLLNCAGSSVRYGGGRGKISCQPTAIARRSPGMPRGAAPIRKGRRPAASLSTKQKRPRMLSQNIKNNVANAKSHGGNH